LDISNVAAANDSCNQKSIEKLHLDIFMVSLVDDEKYFQSNNPLYLYVFRHLTGNPRIFFLNSGNSNG
jgi:hypothetical protein